MNVINKVIGIELVFSKLNDIRSVISFDWNDIDSYYVHLVNPIMFSSGRKVFVPPELSLYDFQRVIQLENLVVDSLVLHLYPCRNRPQEIITYSDYEKSACEMLVLIYDAYYCEVYSKKSEWLSKLVASLKSFSNVKIRLKTIYDDDRTEMLV